MGYQGQSSYIAEYECMTFPNRTIQEEEILNILPRHGYPEKSKLFEF